MTADWEAVDAFMASALLPDDPALAAAQAASEAAGLPPIAVSALQGRLLSLLVELAGARQVLEVGTLGGFSTICLARGLRPDGKVVTLEIDPRHAEIARASFARAGLADTIELRLGPARESLAALAAEGRVFDFVFVDADKGGNVAYLEAALGLCRPGAPVLFDNVVRGGRVLDAGSADPSVAGTRALFERLRGEGRIAATALQTVGEKGHDGFLLGIVRAPQGEATM